jgi:chromosome partitioning protein
LAAALAIDGKKTLLVDTDPQGNSTTGLGIDRLQLASSLYDVLAGTRFLDDVLCQTEVPELLLVPASRDLVGAEVELVNAERREYRLKDALTSVNDKFDYVLLDCPPSVVALTQCALVAATDVIIPVDVGFFSVDGLVRMLSIVEQIRKAYNPQLTLAGILATKFDSRTTLSEQTVQMIRDQELPLFATKIRISVDIIRAQMARSPVSIFAPGSHADADYQTLTEELLPAKVIPLRQRKRAQ